MRKILLVAVLSMLIQSEYAFAADPVTAEKWLCTRDTLARTLRLYAPAKGSAPCKVFYAKRAADDPNDVKIEADENAGLIRPIYYSTYTGSFCVRKMDEFRAERIKQGWNCERLVP